MASPPPNAPTPAYAEAPRRSGLLIALVAIAALVAVAVLVMAMLGGGRVSAPALPGAGPSSDAADPRKSLEAAKAALDQASRNVLQPNASAPPAPAASTDAAAPQDAASPAASIAAAPSTPSPPPRAVAVPETPRPAARPAPAPAPTARPPAAASPAPVSPAPAIVPAPAAPPPPAQVASADRWTQMQEEMDRCSTSSVIPRVQCQQRIRARYCEGYWGSVPACPTGNRRS